MSGRYPLGQQNISCMCYQHMQYIYHY